MAVFDWNKNGTIDLDEMKRIFSGFVNGFRHWGFLKPYNNHVIEPLSRSIYSSVDVNNDWQLDIGEISRWIITNTVICNDLAKYEPVTECEITQHRKMFDPIFKRFVYFTHEDFRKKAEKANNKDKTNDTKDKKANNRRFVKLKNGKIIQFAFVKQIKEKFNDIDKSGDGDIEYKEIYQ